MLKLIGWLGSLFARGGMVALVILAFGLMAPNASYAAHAVDGSKWWKTGPPPNAKQGVYYRFEMQSSNAPYGGHPGGGPTFWDVESGGLPPGLAFKGRNEDVYDGMLIEGTPSQPGTYTVTFIAWAFATSAWRATYTIEVSPAAPPPINPRVSIRKLATNAPGSFGFSLGNLNPSTDSITVNSAGSAVSSSTMHEGSIGGAATLQESSVPSGWPANPVAVSCTDSNAGTSGNASGNLATLSGNTATLPAGVMRNAAVIACTFTNTAPSLIGLSVNGPGSATIGSDLTYALSVNNSGVGPSDTSLVVHNQLPAGVVARAVTPGSGVSSVNCGPLPSTAGALLNCTMSLSSAITRSADRSFSISASMPSSATAGTVLRNYASTSVSGRGPPATAPSPGCVSDANTSCASSTTTVILSGPTVSKDFSPAAIVARDATTLSIRLSNSSSSTAIDGAAFTDAYPAGVVNAAVPDAASASCGSPTITAAPGAASLGVSGASIPAGATCTVTVQVTASAMGSYVNTLGAGSVTASATLVARAQAVVSVQKITTGGTGNFRYGQSNLVANAPSITTTSAGTAEPAYPAPIAAVAARTAVILTEAPAAGFILTGASCTDANAGLTGNPASFGSLSANVLTIAAANVLPGADIRCVFTSAYRPGLSGRVFNDTGAGRGTPNDGIPNGAEPGLAGVVVVLSDCAASSYASVLTDGSGAFELVVPSSVPPGVRLCVEAARALARLSTGASVDASALPEGRPTTVAGTAYTYSRGSSADRIAFVWSGTAGPVPAGLNIGTVPPGSLLQAGLKTGRPGNVLSYGHIFNAGTSGTVSFSVASSVSTPSTPGWTETVLADPGCTGQPQAGAPQLYPPAVAMTVSSGQVVCVLLRESIPAQAAPTSRNLVRLEAGFVLANTASTLSATYAIDDTTTVSSDALDLIKEVRNVSQGIDAFGLNNQARPGDILEYRISYANNAPSPATQFVINDSTPAYTRFDSALAQTTPTSLNACAKTTPASATPVDCAQSQPPGGRGALAWTFSGVLEPGGRGTVLFRVVVD